MESVCSDKSLYTDSVLTYCSTGYHTDSMTATTVASTESVCREFLCIQTLW